MSIKKLLSTTIDQLENIIQVSGESFEKITSDLAEKAKRIKFRI
ncbi:hypothetical protein [Mannheimia haemolytica]|nr:hypothetical protein [Mannheimia haemolytica]